MDRSVVMDRMAELAALLADALSGADCRARAVTIAKELSDLAWEWRRQDNLDEQRMLGISR